MENEFATKYPRLYELGKLNPEMGKKIKRQIRFNKTGADQELKEFLDDSDEKVFNEKITQLRKLFGQPFAKKCRDRYNTYLSDSIREFTPEEDIIIISDHKNNISYAETARKLNIKFAKRVQIRFQTLTKKKNKDNLYPTEGYQYSSQSNQLDFVLQNSEAALLFNTFQDQSQNVYTLPILPVNIRPPTTVDTPLVHTHEQDIPEGETVHENDMQNENTQISEMLFNEFIE